MSALWKRVIEGESVESLRHDFAAASDAARAAASAAAWKKMAGQLIDLLRDAE